jgi:hypothetical protein
MKAVADTLEVARPNLIEQVKRGAARPRDHYRKAGDAALLARIRPLLDTRPSYGYRRVTALLNRYLRRSSRSARTRRAATSRASAVRHGRNRCLKGTVRAGRRRLP